MQVWVPPRTKIVQITPKHCSVEMVDISPCTHYPGRYQHSDKSKTDGKKKSHRMTTQELLFFIITADNHVPCSASAQPPLPQAAPQNWNWTLRMCLQRICPLITVSSTIKKPSGKTWMFQIFTTLYRLRHHLRLTTWCHLFQHQSARLQPFCLIVLLANSLGPSACCTKTT